MSLPAMSAATLIAPMAVHAQATDMHTITIDANGGYFETTDFDDDGNEIIVKKTSISGELEDQYNLDTAWWFDCYPVSSNGKGFIGLSEKKNPTADELIDVDNIGDMTFTKDTTLYAIWGDIRTLTLHANNPNAVFLCNKYDETTEEDIEWESDTAKVECTLNPIQNKYYPEYVDGTMNPLTEDDSQYFGWWSTNPNADQGGTLGENFQGYESLSYTDITGNTDLYAVWNDKIPVASSDIKVTLDHSKFTYKGYAQAPWIDKLQVGDQVFKGGVGAAGIKVKYPNSKNAGTYKLTVTLKGIWCKYTGSKTITYTIAKAKQPMTVKPVKRTVKAGVLKTKAKTVKCPLSIKKKQGKVTFTKVAKGSSKKLTVNKKTGKVTVKRGTERGKYKIKLKVKAAGTRNYKSGTKTVTATIVVK